MEYRTLSRLIYFTAGLFVALWFAHEILQVILLLFFAIVFTIVLNAPVVWLERKNIRRPIASLIVFFAVILCLALLGWMVHPAARMQYQTHIYKTLLTLIPA